MEKLHLRWLGLFVTCWGCAGAAGGDVGGLGSAGATAVTAMAGSGGGASTTVGGSTTGGSLSGRDSGGAPDHAAGAGGGQAIAGMSFGGAAGGVGGGTAGAAGGGAAAVDPASLPNVTLHLAGDSTVMTYAAGSAQEGWGQELPQYLLGKVTLDNQALGGSSVQTFYAGRWQTILTKLRAGDYVMAAFGANDSGSVAGRHVDPAAFQAQFEKMAEEVNARRATFIAVTPSALQEWNNGVEGNQRLAPYVSVLHVFSTEKQVALVDLNARSLELLNQIGQSAAQDIYINGDKAHFTRKGATIMAKLVAEELQRSGSSLGAYVK